jgi:hypothetical protein
MPSTLSLFHFVVQLTLQSDYIAFVAREVLEERNTPKDLTPEDLASKNPGPRTKFIRNKSQALLQMILTRVVDGFNTYMSEIIRAALRARPEVLRSQEQVRLDYLLKFTSLDELREDRVDRKVLELGYKGFHDLDEWCQSRLGIVVRDCSFKLGEVRTLKFDYLYASASLLFNTVSNIDQEMASKFGLPTNAYVQSKEKEEA